jgi:iron complex outermembrane receptor protein
MIGTQKLIDRSGGSRSVNEANVSWGNGMNRSTRAVLCASAAAAGLFAGSKGWAQQSPSVPTTAGAAEVQEVVVTAQKREQSVQSVAASITALSGADLDRRGITTVQDLQFAVPSFRAAFQGEATDITIRGVGSTQNGLVSTPGVAVSVDGIYQPNSLTAAMAQLDLQRAEVLLGPQGTLYGRNAVGGSINFLTNAPTDKFEGSLLAGYASYDEYHLQAIVNVPLSDRVRTRLLVDYDDREDGFIKNINPGGSDLDKGSTLSTRFRLSADITSNLTFDLGVSEMHSSGSQMYVVNAGNPAPSAYLAIPFLVNAKYISTPWLTNEDYPARSTRDYESASGTFTWRLPFGTLKSITAYQDFLNPAQLDADGTNLSYINQVDKVRDRTFTQEFDLSGHWGRLDWVGGFFYLFDHNSNYVAYEFPQGQPPYGFPPGAIALYSQPLYDSSSYAAFTDGTFHITKALKLIAGVRYSRDDQTAVYGSTLSWTNGGPPITLCPQETDRLKFTSVTPRAGLQYDLNPSMKVYFTYSEGYKAGGANVYACHDDYKPETITSYEGGFKSRLFNNSVTLDLSIFHYDYTNFQVMQILGLVDSLTNAKAAMVNGAEVEGAWTPNRHWTLNANFSYINAIYTDFYNTDNVEPQLGVQNVAGHLLDNSPRESGDVGIAYRTDLLSFGRLTARFDSSFSSRVYFTEFNGPFDSQAPYGVVNLNLIWDSLDQKYTIRFYVTNLTDKAYKQQSIGVPIVDTYSVVWNDPRQIGGEFKMRF